jgi:hypothetical protein
MVIQLDLFKTKIDCYQHSIHLEMLERVLNWGVSSDWSNRTEEQKPWRCLAAALIHFKNAISI